MELRKYCVTKVFLKSKTDSFIYLFFFRQHHISSMDRKWVYSWVALLPDRFGRYVKTFLPATISPTTSNWQYFRTSRGFHGHFVSAKLRDCILLHPDRSIIWRTLLLKWKKKMPTWQGSSKRRFWHSSIENMTMTQNDTLSTVLWSYLLNQYERLYFVTV